jgi:hypothetical protein
MARFFHSAQHSSFCHQLQMALTVSVSPLLYQKLFALKADVFLQFFKNTWVVNTTSGVIISADVEATVTYANNALHGFGTLKFLSADPQFIDLVWRNFVAEFEGNFFTGTAIVDIFELSSGGHRDGSPILALLPPGQASAR